MNPPAFPLLVNTLDSGGAASAVLRLLDGLRQIDVPAQMLTYYKTQTAPHVLGILNQTSGLQRLWMRAVMRYSRNWTASRRARTQKVFSANLLSYPVDRTINALSPDIVHLHWIARGLIPISAIPRITAPIVWTLQIIFQIVCTDRRLACI